MREEKPHRARKSRTRSTATASHPLRVCTSMCFFVRVRAQLLSNATEKQSPDDRSVTLVTGMPWASRRQTQLRVLGSTMQTSPSDVPTANLPSLRGEMSTEVMGDGVTSRSRAPPFDQSAPLPASRVVRYPPRAPDAAVSSWDPSVLNMAPRNFSLTGDFAAAALSEGLHFVMSLPELTLHRASTPSSHVRKRPSLGLKTTSRMSSECTSSVLMFPFLLSAFLSPLLYFHTLTVDPWLISSVSPAGLAPMARCEGACSSPSATSAVCVVPTIDSSDPGLPA
mmetsp:Transcript_25652/g.65231  ORF Transcript_25652/g.65231 Transcript_25652/m.65231 type:complete len:281 (-) Transcript_25652:308-1150(-)